MEIENKELVETADISAPHSSAKDHLNLLLSVLGLLLFTYFFIWSCSKIAVHFFPDTLENKIFSVISKSKDFDSVNTESKEFKNALRIFNKLEAGAAQRDLNYKLCYMKDEAMNAFALPGGTICITQGLLNNVHSEMGIAMVLGHEFGHHELKHLLKRLSSIITLQLVYFVISGSNSSVFDNHLMDIFKFADSRTQELEADDYGYDLVKKIYGTTNGSLEFFEKSLTKEGDSHWQALAVWLDSHPDTKKRIERLRRK